VLNRAKATGETSQIGRRRNLALEKSSESYQVKRREIARAAAHVFNKRGFRGTSLTAVAAELGMDRATLYYYIGNKQELFDAVVREVSEENVALAEQVRSGDGTPLEKLRILVTSLMVSYAHNYPLLYVYLRENLAHVESERSEWSTHMRSLNRRYEEAIIAVVQEGIDNGSIRPLSSSRVIAFGIIGMTGWTNRWFVPDRSAETAEQIGEAYAEMVISGLSR
jgi:TetR/AcrR family transcriptional regulator, cholesterol catabolism regulator